METNKKIICICIVITVINIILIIINYNKLINMRNENSTVTTKTTSISTTTTANNCKQLQTTAKTTQVKTTKKVEVKPKSTATGSKAEYIQYAKEYGNLNDTQLTCLDYLWQHESNWNPNDVNKSSGACGIPQAYPCKKIEQSEGSNDWKAQIRWGIKYINNRYKNPCAAWNHFKNKKWY